jgi:hypothetical protein
MVTMPVHPLKGLQLELLRTRYDHRVRRQMLLAQLPDGGRILLPLDWTDRGQPWVAPMVDGQEVKLCPRGLLALSRAVDAAQRKEVGPLSSPCSGSEEVKQAPRSADGSSRDHGGGVGGANVSNAARSRRRVGKPGAQDASAKRGCR